MHVDLFMIDFTQPAEDIIDDTKNETIKQIEHLDSNDLEYDRSTGMVIKYDSATFHATWEKEYCFLYIEYSQNVDTHEIIIQISTDPDGRNILDSFNTLIPKDETDE